MNAHRKLLAWQACRELIRLVYAATRSFPAEVRYGLTSQLRRAAVSAATNITEGYARTGRRETAHGLSIALGSLAEVDTLFAVCEDQGYLTAVQFEVLTPAYEQASKLTFGLHRKMRP